VVTQDLILALGRGNSCKILPALYGMVLKITDLRLSFIEAGNMRNAIPREGFAIVTLPAEAEKDKYVKCVRELS
jgi:dipeptidase D